MTPLSAEAGEQEFFSKLFSRTVHRFSETYGTAGKSVAEKCRARRFWEGPDFSRPLRQKICPRFSACGELLTSSTTFFATSLAEVIFE